MTLNSVHMGQGGPLMGLKQGIGIARFLLLKDRQQIHKKVKA